jgi:hypothetical protein
METTMTLIEQLQANAKTLAVAYQGLWSKIAIAEEARKASDWNFIVVWADLVKTKQASLGIDLMTVGSLDNYIRQGRIEIERIEREGEKPPHNEPSIDGVY